MVFYGFHSCPIIASGVAAVSGAAVSVIITGLVLCVLVLVIVKLRGLCKQVVDRRGLVVFACNMHDYCKPCTL